MAIFAATETETGVGEPRDGEADEPDDGEHPDAAAADVASLWTQKPVKNTEHYSALSSPCFPQQA